MIPINNIQCPLCGRTIQLKPKPGDFAHLAALCDCGSGHYRNVIEIDDPHYVSLEDRLEPGEPEAPRTWHPQKTKRSKL